MYRCHIIPIESSLQLVRHVVPREDKLQVRTALFQRFLQSNLLWRGHAVERWRKGSEAYSCHVLSKGLSLNLADKILQTKNDLENRNASTSDSSVSPLFGAHADPFLKFHQPSKLSLNRRNQRISQCFVHASLSGMEFTTAFNQDQLPPISLTSKLNNSGQMKSTY